MKLNNEQISTLTSTVWEGCTSDEVAYLAQLCENKKLDPFSRQIHALHSTTGAEDDSGTRKKRLVPIIGIDGLRLQAIRTGKYRGATPPQWCGPDGKWVDVWLGDKPPAACKVGIHREGFAEPLVRVALYREFVATKFNGQPNKMWSRMPANQLQKCAEAGGLRQAFPDECGDLYILEEIPPQEPAIQIEKAESPLMDDSGSTGSTTGPTMVVNGYEIPLLHKQSESAAKAQPEPPPVPPQSAVTAPNPPPAPTDGKALMEEGYKSVFSLLFPDKPENEFRTQVKLVNRFLRGYFGLADAPNVKIPSNFTDIAVALSHAVEELRKSEESVSAFLDNPYSLGQKMRIGLTYGWSLPTAENFCTLMKLRELSVDDCHMWLKATGAVGMEESELSAIMYIARFTRNIKAVIESGKPLRQLAARLAASSAPADEIDAILAET